VNPDEVIKEYGADSLRMYEMFMGPIDRAKPWSTEGLGGIHRFLNRIWRIYVDENEEINPQICNKLDNTLEISFHKMVKTVTEHIEQVRFNTAISQMMIFINDCYKAEFLYRPHMLDFIKILSVFAPHIGEELWQRMGSKDVLSYSAWPLYDPEKAKDEMIEYPVQINGKVRFKINISSEAVETDIREALKDHEKYAFYTEGKQILKCIVIPRKIITLVLK